ncbi:hypothetical protein FA13DRAFT_1735875 [Coprinellus micaceus]|uniref:Uncharacterized protein n=1 Tax=Coprinellus micaceus TaxID=71717 RepID=A0A4Y7T3U9_COPMI|nr:hypothetical protein FA13DRAFT_1735875 [Coprinellus micaceus]
MPQANTIDLEAFEASKSNLDLISDRRAGDYYYPPPSSLSKHHDRSRERTYSAPTRPLFHGGGTQHQSGKRSEDDDVDSDPVERMRKNLERSTFLLSSLKVSLGPKPEEIQVLPPRPGSSSSVSSTSSANSRYGVASPESVARHHSEPQKHSSSYYESHPPPAPPQPTSCSRHPSHTHPQSLAQDHTQAPSNPKSKPPRSRLVAPGMDRSDSNATAFSIAVSTYSRGDAQPRGSRERVPPAHEPRREHRNRRREIFEPTPKIVSRPFPPEYLPYPSPPPNLPPPPKRGHGRSVSVSHAPLPRDPQPAMGSGRKRVPDVGMRRVRFDF